MRRMTFIGPFHSPPQRPFAAGRERAMGLSPPRRRGGSTADDGGFLTRDASSAKVQLGLYFKAPPPHLASYLKACLCNVSLELMSANLPMAAYARSTPPLVTAIAKVTMFSPPLN